MNLKVKHYHFYSEVLQCQSWSAIVLNIKMVGSEFVLSSRNPWKEPALCEQFSLVVVYWCEKDFLLPSCKLSISGMLQLIWASFAGYMHPFMDMIYSSYNVYHSSMIMHRVTQHKLSQSFSALQARWADWKNRPRNICKSVLMKRIPYLKRFCILKCVFEL